MKLEKYVDRILEDRKRVYHEYVESVKDENPEAAHVYERLEESLQIIQEEIRDFVEEYPKDGDQN